MKSYKTTNGYEIIQILSGRCNAYLIRKGDTCILVDTSVKKRFSKLCQTLEIIGVPIESISYLILTHTHFDHCQSVKAIQEKSGCEIIVSSQAKDFIQQGFTPHPKGTNAYTRFLNQIEKLIGKTNFCYAPFDANILVGDKYVLKIENFSIEITATPGHSADSVSIIVDNEVALVGDAMFGVFKNSVFPPFADDVPQLIKSWGKLLQTNCVIFLPGHGFEISHELLMQEYKKHNELCDVN